MDFRLDDEQLELRDTVRRLCADRFALADLARREAAPGNRDDWRALADLGVFAVLRPASNGGSGFGAVGAAVVFEQLGAHLVRPRVVDDPRHIVARRRRPGRATRWRHRAAGLAW